MQLGLFEKLEPGESGALVPVRRFSDEAIQGAIDAALANVSAKSAVLEVEAGQHGFTAVVAANLDGRWSVAAAFRRDEWGSSAGATVRFAW